jgi:hypothetical protein
MRREPPEEAGSVQRAPVITGLQAETKLARQIASGKGGGPSEPEKPCMAAAAQVTTE